MFHFALAGAAAAYGASLATMTPEARRTYLTERARRLELERFDASPEVKLARETIEREELKGEHAEQLLSFARDLARRREG